MKVMQGIIIVCMVFVLSSCQVNKSEYEKLEDCIAKMEEAKSDDGCPKEQRLSTLKDYLDTYFEIFSELEMNLEIDARLIYTNDDEIHFTVVYRDVPNDNLEETQFNLFYATTIDILNSINEITNVKLRVAIGFWYEDGTWITFMRHGNESTFQLIYGQRDIYITDMLSKYEGILNTMINDENTDIVLTNMWSSYYDIKLNLYKSSEKYSISVEEYPNEDNPYTESELYDQLFSEYVDDDYHNLLEFD